MLGEAILCKQVCDGCVEDVTMDQCCVGNDMMMDDLPQIKDDNGNGSDGTHEVPGRSIDVVTQTNGQWQW